MFGEIFFGSMEIVAEASAFLQEAQAKPTLQVFLAQLEKVEQFDQTVIPGVIKSTGLEAGVKGKMLFMPIRIGTTGQMHGPELADTLVLLGKNQVITNLKKTISEL